VSLAPYSLSSPLLLTHAGSCRTSAQESWCAWERRWRRTASLWTRTQAVGAAPPRWRRTCKEDFNSFTDAAHEGGDSSSSASCRSCSSEMVANMPGRTSTPPPMSRPRPAVGRRSVGRRRSPQQRKGDGLGAKHGGRSTGELEMGRWLGGRGDFFTGKDSRSRWRLIFYGPHKSWAPWSCSSLFTMRRRWETGFQTTSFSFILETNF
jgi:hypothetical protein